MKHVLIKLLTEKKKVYRINSTKLGQEALQSLKKKTSEIIPTFAHDNLDDKHFFWKKTSNWEHTIENAGFRGKKEKESSFKPRERKLISSISEMLNHNY